MGPKRFFITGAMGCIGAWVCYHLLRQGHEVISFDVSDKGHRLDYLMGKDKLSRITFIKGDLRDFAQIKDTLNSYKISHIIHLAALQVPFCKENPMMGSEVNVTGTVNIFEAAYQCGISHISYASSIAVYGPPELYPEGLIQYDAPYDPRTLYGVYKVANEGTAKIYWQDKGVSSIGLRPYTIYGLGRDQGLTSDPTKALLAVAMGKAFTINFSGDMQFQWASDVAQTFIQTAQNPIEKGTYEGANIFNLGGVVHSVAEFVAMVQALRPEARIQIKEMPLPFPKGFDDSRLRALLPAYHETPLVEGIKRTLLAFEDLYAQGKISEG
ncbi:NAD-dependent epimerase/dehydratase [Anaerolineales bacterium]